MSEANHPTPDDIVVRLRRAVDKALERSPALLEEAADLIERERKAHYNYQTWAGERSRSSNSSAVTDDGQLWLFIRDTLSRGANIERDYRERPYEEFSAHLDRSALELLTKMQRLPCPGAEQLQKQVKGYRDALGRAHARADRNADERDAAERKLGIAQDERDQLRALANGLLSKAVELRRALRHVINFILPEHRSVRCFGCEEAEKLSGEPDSPPYQMTASEESSFTKALARSPRRLPDETNGGLPAPTHVRFTDCADEPPHRVLEWARMPSGSYVVLAGKADNFDSFWFDANGKHPKSELIFNFGLSSREAAVLFDKAFAQRSAEKAGENRGDL